MSELTPARLGRSIGAVLLRHKAVRLLRLGFYVGLAGAAAIVSACGSATQTKVNNKPDAAGDADAPDTGESGPGGSGGQAGAASGGAAGQAGAASGGTGGAVTDGGVDAPTDALWDVPYE